MKRSRYMSEEMQEKRISEAIKRSRTYLRKYEPQMEALHDSPLARVRKLGPYDVWALGEQLDRANEYINWVKETGTASDLGPLPKIALDVLTASYGTSVLPLISSTQPLEEIRGIVYFKRTVARNTRGNVTAGDVLQDPRRAPDAYPRGFASEDITVSLETTTAGTTDYAGTIAGISTSNPIRPNSFRVRCALPYLSVEAQDDGKGNFFGVGIQGKIDYTSGLWTLRFLDDPDATAGLVAIYGSDFEAGAPYSKIDLLNDSMPVEARTFVLGSELGMFKSFQLNKRFGMTGEDEMIADLTNEMNSELGNYAIHQITSNVTGDMVEWSKTHSGYSWAEHKLELKDAIAHAEGNIITNAGRGRVTTIIAGPNAATTLGTLDGFEKIEVANSGPVLFGTLDGIAVIRSPYTETNKIYTLYKGTDMFDTTCVYGPFMPLFVTNTLPVAGNVLQRQGLAATQAAFAVVAPAFINGVEITA